MWNRIVRAFELFRKAWGLRTLLDLVGIWKWIALGGAAVAALAIQVWACISHLPPPIVVVVGLATCALTLAVVAFGVLLWRVGKTQEPLAKSSNTHKGRPPAFLVALGCVLAVLAVVGFLTKYADKFVGLRWRTRQTDKFVVLVADFDYNSPRLFGLTQQIVEHLRRATEVDGDIEIRVLRKPIPWEDGSAAARREGQEHNAAVVIWGDYSAPKDRAAFNINFEILKTPPHAPVTPDAAPLIIPNAFARNGYVPVYSLETFTIQEQVSGEMVYLTLMVSGLARYSAGDWGPAIDRFSQALKAPEPREMVGPEVIYFYRGTAHGLLGHRKEPTKTFSRAIQLNPHLGPAFANRGIARSHYDDDSALADYKRAIELNPCDAATLVNLGLLFRRRGNIDLAIANYDKAIECDRTTFRAFVCRGVAWDLKGQQERAISDYNSALKLVPNSAEVYDNRGNSFAANGDFDQAIADRTRAIKLNPRMAEAFLNRGNAFRDKHEYQRALEDYNKAVAIDPASFAASYGRATVCFATGKLTQSVDDFSETIRLNPKFAMTFNNRATANVALGRIDQAIDDYGRAIELDGGLADAYNRRGLLFWRRDFRRAAADMRQVCELATTDATARQLACAAARIMSSYVGRLSGQ